MKCIKLIYKENKAAQIKKENEEKTKAEEQAIISGEKTLKHNGKEYRVTKKSDGLFDEKEFQAQLSKKGYSGVSDESIPNGTVIKYRDVGITRTQNYKYRVYYDGEWYLLENA